METKKILIKVKYLVVLHRSFFAVADDVKTREGNDTTFNVVYVTNFLDKIIRNVKGLPREFLRTFEKQLSVG